jgi:hypothetical protein
MFRAPIDCGSVLEICGQQRGNSCFVLTLCKGIERVFGISVPSRTAFAMAETMTASRGEDTNLVNCILGPEDGMLFIDMCNALGLNIAVVGVFYDAKKKAEVVVRTTYPGTRDDSPCHFGMHLKANHYQLMLPVDSVGQISRESQDSVLSIIHGVLCANIERVADARARARLMAVVAPDIQAVREAQERRDAEYAREIAERDAQAQRDAEYAREIAQRDAQALLDAEFARKIARRDAKALRLDMVKRKAREQRDVQYAREIAERDAQEQRDVQYAREVLVEMDTALARELAAA